MSSSSPAPPRASPEPLPRASSRTVARSSASTSTRRGSSRWPRALARSASSSATWPSASTHERAADAAEELGQLRGWVNGAGIWAKTRAHDFAEEDLDRILAVNLKGSILGCSVACARFSPAARAAAIVNVSSIEAIVAFPDAVAYEASKGGIDALTRQVAVDYGPAGIRCNGVRPGAIMTPLADVYLEAYAEDREEMLQSWRDLSPLGLVGEPEDVAAVITFLLSGRRALRHRRARRRRRWRDRALLPLRARARHRRRP